MKASLLFWALGLATFASATTAEYEDDLIFSRAVNSKCNAPLGRGTCQHAANCPGVSYPTGLCPHDPKDVQCCYKKTCKVPNVGSGYCRSVKNNGCPSGKFHAGFCPGNKDIQCCVKNAAKPPTKPKPSPCTVAAFEKLVFQDSISTFVAAKRAQSPSCFIWKDDGCSCSPDDLGEFDFTPPCWRHDFGYRNSQDQGRFDDAMKKRIDDNFKDDLYDVCKKFSGWQSYKGVECRRIADLYVAGVRRFGKKKRDESSGELQKRKCDLADILF